MESKNKFTLDSFVAHCIDHPNERFWQALRNWSKYSFIYGQKRGLPIQTIECEVILGRTIEDTFYIQDDDKDQSG